MVLFGVFYVTCRIATDRRADGIRKRRNWRVRCEIGEISYLASSPYTWHMGGFTTSHPLKTDPLSPDF
jgi:hypothetical protein